jgi:serine/threonine protein phosphatase PrpC
LPCHLTHLLLLLAVKCRLLQQLAPVYQLLQTYPCLCLQVSRAFGDAQFKPFGSSAAPDVTAFSISSRDLFMLCACDGFWGGSVNSTGHHSNHCSTAQQNKAQHCMRPTDPMHGLSHIA